MRKEIDKTILEMTLLGEVHDKSENEKMTLISEVDENILELMKNKRATIVKKDYNSLRKHVEDYVLKLLH